MSIKDWLIKKLGGYTERENMRDRVNRIEECYTCLHNPYTGACKVMPLEAFCEANLRKFALVKDAPADTKLPTRKTKGSAGYDFCSYEAVTINPNQTIMIKTGIKAYMLDDEVLQQLFNSKKNSFNENYDINIEGIPVELYIEDVKASNATLGIYSITKNEWVK